jgi:hypothetical protein
MLKRQKNTDRLKTERYIHHSNHIENDNLMDVITKPLQFLIDSLPTYKLGNSLLGMTPLNLFLRV